MHLRFSFAVRSLLTAAALTGCTLVLAAGPVAQAGAAKKSPNQPSKGRGARAGAPDAAGGAGARGASRTKKEASPVALSPIDFNRDVRPILSANCFKCHGPDEKTRLAGLRLDDARSAVARLRSGRRAIVPSRPEASEFIRRIDAHGGLKMPPESSGKALTAQQRAILRRWIAAGARYEKHWAFVPPSRPALPPVRRQGWARNPIDRFILARIEKAGLAPSPEADRYTLVRRLYLDLTGLPPSPEETDAFVADSSPAAYESLVDRLLASPHYGERWARRWLDLARYADTNGYEKDRPRTIWPYRDWVIRALNADMPFDRFTIEQIAGDMLPNPTVDQKVATGFHRNTMINEEGGIDPLEYRFHAMVDRVSTTGSVWLGLTLGCAQCHTHKFDPVSQTEYYRFMALLDNADEPELALPDRSFTSRREEAEKRLLQAEMELARDYPGGEESLNSAFSSWLTAQRKRLANWTRVRPLTATSNLPRLQIEPDGAVFADGDMSKRDLYSLTLPSMEGVTAIRIDALPDPRLPRGGPGRIYYEGPAGDFFLSEVTLMSGGKRIPLKNASADFAAANGAPAGAIDGDPQSGWAINGAQAKAHYLILNLTEPLAAGELKLDLLFERYYAAGLGRFAVSTTVQPVEVTAHEAAVEHEALLARDEGSLDEAGRRALLHQFLLKTPELKKQREGLEPLRAAIPEPVRTLVMQERPAGHPRETKIRHRGEYLQPKESVTPGIPALFPQSGPVPGSRLELARWLVSRQNPLTARVTVNRAWADFFGHGFVRTPGDFGYQGAPPSHPELLDWLAVEFMEQGWSLKRLHRLIVTSAAYRQSSQPRPELRRADPENRLLAVGPRLRLQAEMLRDSALLAAGLLSRQIGGPSVFPPQPPGVTKEGTYGPLEWKVSEGEQRFRRGLYTFAKRTAPYAQFNTFDGPTGETCLVQRAVTNTPLQALTLLNDVVFVEAAQALGAAAAAQADDKTRARFILRRVLTREPAPAEIEAVVEFVGAQRARLAAGELNKVDLAGRDGPNAEDAAAWSAAARVVLNLDEAIVRR